MHKSMPEKGRSMKIPLWSAMDPGSFKRGGYRFFNTGESCFSYRKLPKKWLLWCNPRAVQEKLGGLSLALRRNAPCAAKSHKKP